MCKPMNIEINGAKFQIGVRLATSVRIEKRTSDTGTVVTCENLKFFRILFRHNKAIVAHRQIPLGEDLLPVIHICHFMSSALCPNLISVG